MHWKVGRVNCTFKVRVRRGWADLRAFLAEVRTEGTPAFQLPASRWGLYHVLGSWADLCAFLAGRGEGQLPAVAFEACMLEERRAFELSLQSLASSLCQVQSACNCLPPLCRG